MGSNTLQITESLFNSHDLIITENDDNSSLIIKGEEKIKDLILNNSISSDKKFELKTEAYILKLAYTNNKLLSLSNSRTQILAHQVESTYRIINSLNQRFLIADEVGLGKTIEAGLVVKELIFRYEYNRILIVCPASLLMQWQNELRSKFNEAFTIMDRKKLSKIIKGIDNHFVNPWEKCDKIICSLDFIKNKSNLEDLKRAQWDVIIMDEAHRLRRDSLKSTLAYNVAEILSKNTKSFLLLTATPFRGKLEELYYLIQLIDENLLGPFQTFYNAYCLYNPDYAALRKKISTVIIRRTKKEVGGFTKRYAKTIRFELSSDERTLYDATTRYVVEEFNKAMQTENRAIGFVMTVFQKLLDSSTFALLSALKKRRAHLSSVVEGSENDVYMNKLIEKKLNIDLNDIDDPDGYEDLVNQTLKKTRAELKVEILILGNLVRIAESINYNTKGEKLREILLRLKKNKCRKVLIFTQFKTTQTYLKDLLYDFKIELFHGSMDKNQKEDAIQNFKDNGEILISTEAGGEGRNLQFCSILINFDLPWSPLKIEQRIGRIHRFGQPKDVNIYNFSTKDTVAERVLEVLTLKLKLFEESIGAPDIILGQIEDGLNLNALFMDMAAKRKSTREINKEINNKLITARESYDKLSDLTILKKMDFNYDEYYRITLNDRDYSNKRIENFINILSKNTQSVHELLGKKHKINRYYPIKMLPCGSKPVLKNGTFSSSRALNNENLDFLAFGNPIIDHLINKCSDENFGGLTGVKIIKYKKIISGMIFYYLVTFTSKDELQELISVFVPVNNTMNDKEIEELELKSLEQLSATNHKLERYKTELSKIKKRSEIYFDSARGIIKKRIGTKIHEISSNINKSVTPEIEKIEDSYNKKIKEYEEQLSRQVCQMKWHSKDMKGAITRTENKIIKTKAIKNEILAQYISYRYVKYSVELINAGYLLTEA